MRPSERPTALLGVVCALSFVPLAAHAEDPPHGIDASKDHPLPGRVPGAVIRSYRQTNCDDVALPGARVAPGGKPRMLDVSGRVTRIGYSVDSKNSFAELAHNDAQALDDGHVVKMFNCRVGPTARPCRRAAVELVLQ